MGTLPAYDVIDDGADLAHLGSVGYEGGLAGRGEISKGHAEGKEGEVGPQRALVGMRKVGQGLSDIESMAAGVNVLGQGFYTGAGAVAVLVGRLTQKKLELPHHALHDQRAGPEGDELVAQLDTVKSE